MSEQLWNDREMLDSVELAYGQGYVLPFGLVERKRDAYEAELARLQGENDDHHVIMARLLAENERLREFICIEMHICDDDIDAAIADDAPPQVQTEVSNE